MVLLAVGGQVGSVQYRWSPGEESGSGSGVRVSRMARWLLYNQGWNLALARPSARQDLQETGVYSSLRVTFWMERVGGWGEEEEEDC